MQFRAVSECCRLQAAVQCSGHCYHVLSCAAAAFCLQKPQSPRTRSRSLRPARRAAAMGDGLADWGGLGRWAWGLWISLDSSALEGTGRCESGPWAAADRARGGLGVGCFGPVGCCACAVVRCAVLCLLVLEPALYVAWHAIVTIVGPWLR